MELRLIKIHEALIVIDIIHDINRFLVAPVHLYTQNLDVGIFFSFPNMIMTLKPQESFGE